MALAELTGRVVSLLPERSGHTNDGRDWRSQDVMIEEMGSDHRCCFTIFGDKIDSFGLRPGEMIKVLVALDGREYQGRLYASVTAVKLLEHYSPTGPQADPFDGIDPAAVDPYRTSPEILGSSQSLAF